MASTRSRSLQLRLKPRQLADWKAMAKRMDVTLSAWIRDCCDAELPRRSSTIVRPGHVTPAKRALKSK